MKALATALSTALVAIFALPSAALAEYLVPPGNSAVNQYTESVPTAGGHRDVDKGKGKGNRSPGKVLGEENTRRLEEQGEEGREAAEVAAATAPSSTPPVEATSEPDDEDEGSAAGGKGSQGGGGGGEAAVGPGRAVDRAPAANGTPNVEAVQVEGSSGIGEVLTQATGSSSSGQLGLLLPLILVATAAWAVAFFRRERKQPTP